VTGGQLQAEFRDHSSTINSLDFHPQELMLASGSDDKYFNTAEVLWFYLMQTCNLLLSTTATV